MEGINTILNTMQSDLRKLNSIGHNLANVDTNAYKRIVADLEVQSIDLVGKELAITGSNNINIVSSSRVDYSNGALKFTGRSLNVAIEGDGYFQVRDNAGTWLTRQGELKVDSEGYLTLLDGSKLQGIDGDIQVQPGTIEIRNNGELYQEGDQVIAKIAVVDASDNMLQEIGKGKYSSPSVSLLEQPSVRQEFLEMSNVNHLHEMVSLVELTRHFEGSQQVLQGYSTMMEELVSKVGRI
ncbi:flagellar hook-basal body protein [Microbulbifer epialgicus]|uniref:Flagellar hook-basal body protein n=1 Tax=Microbulbifer epialgicus TaxID=393907 RepID=A0ABV4NXT7_9GAMM